MVKRKKLTLMEIDIIEDLEEIRETELKFPPKKKPQKRKPKVSPKKKPQKRKPKVSPKKKRKLKQPPPELEYIFYKEKEPKIVPLELELDCYDPDSDKCRKGQFCNAMTGKCISKIHKHDYKLKINKRSTIIGTLDRLQELNKQFKGKGKIIAPVPKVVMRPDGILEALPEPTKEEEIEKFIEEALAIEKPPKVKKPKKMKKIEIEEKISDRALKEYAKLEKTIKKCLGVK